MNLKIFNNTMKNKKYIYIIYKSILYISVFFIILFISILIKKAYLRAYNDNLSKELLSSYNIVKLYGNSNNEIDSLNVDPFVIGIIRIEKIDLNYPILSDCNKDLLEISICRFAGPLPNSIGNLCLAGHNYVDYRLFSRINELDTSDIIEIFDLNGKLLKYTVYDKFEIFSDDISCMSQQTSGQKIITLLTCNNVNGKRTVIKAKESK